MNAPSLIDRRQLAHAVATAVAAEQGRLLLLVLAGGDDAAIAASKAQLKADLAAMDAAARAFDDALGIRLGQKAGA